MVVLQAIADFGNWFWGLPILFLIVGGGLWITVRLGFVQFRRFGYICSQTFGKMFAKAEDGKVSPFSAACAALASSIGASNIVGVPTAVVMGGTGAVFWIWLIALVGCATKYTEIALAVKYREKNEDGEWVGGPFYYLRALGGGLGKFLGTFFAIGLMIELVPSLCTQALSATSQFVILGVPEPVSGTITAILVAIIIAGGFSRITKVMDIMVPVMAIIYMAGAFVIIFMNASQILPAIKSIFVYAFTPHAAVGGFAGSTIALALRWGAARGVYSNEAGFGTAPNSHASADVDHPIRQAVWGVFEVTVDTLIVCTVTALLTLTTGTWTTTEYQAGSIAQAAFHDAFGVAGDWFVAICVWLFVFSTIVVSAFYGYRQAEFLFGLKFSKIWRYIYPITMIIATAGIELTFMYMITDGFLAAIMIPNMIGLIIMVPQVAKLQKEYFNTPDRYYLADKAAKLAKKAAK